MVYGARLESVLGSRPHEFESRILRQQGFWVSQNPFLLLTSTTPRGLVMVSQQRLASHPHRLIRQGTESDACPSQHDFHPSAVIDQTDPTSLSQLSRSPSSGFFD